MSVRRLGGRYELGDVIGEGGMAHVFAAHDARLDRRVAVKMLLPDLAAETGFVDRFRREARAAGALNHPNIVVVHDTGVDEDDGFPVPYIVMEYVDGRTLRQALAAGERPALVRCLAITVTVLRALGYSHRRGIVHRDVKPSNVMLAASGVVKVMDFGIARTTTGAVDEDTTQVGVVLGTPRYLSPELLRGLPTDPRSDLYSVGCLLYELLTGRPPFSGPTPVVVATQHLETTPDAPSTRAPHVSPALDAVVLRALAKEPAERYRDAAEMAEALLAAEPAVGGEPITASLPGRPSTSPTPSPTRLLPAADLPVAAAVPPVYGGPELPSGPGRAPEPGGPKAGGPKAGLREIGVAEVPARGRKEAPGRRRWLIGAGALVVVGGAAALVASLAGNPSASAPPVPTPSPAPARTSPPTSGTSAQPPNGAPTPRTTGTTPTPSRVPTPTPTSATRPASVVVPFVPSGLPLVLARAEIFAAGLRVRVTSVNDPAVSAGTVVRTDPASGSVVPAGSTVTVEVASPRGGGVVLPTLQPL